MPDAFGIDADKLRATFNSLFEMPDAFGSFEKTLELWRLSILYLRCPLAPASLPPRDTSILSILYLRCLDALRALRLIKAAQLSILYSRCTSCPVRAVLKSMLDPFNSLFEMRNRRADSGEGEERCAFNSLFEMHCPHLSIIMMRLLIRFQFSI